MIHDAAEDTVVPSAVTEGVTVRRFQLSRARGWRLPEGGRSVAAPTKWANQFRPVRRSLAENTRAVEAFRQYLRDHPELVEAARRELRGRDLGCWCALSLPCHADVWIEVANGAEP